MLRTRSHKILGDVWARKGRTALVILSIMIGVMGVTMLVSLGDIILKQLEKDMQPEHMPMLYVAVSVPNGQLTLEESQAALAKLAALPEVTAVEGNAIYAVSWRTPDETEFNENFLVAASVPFDAMTLTPINEVLEGRFPVAGQHEIAVEQRFAKTYGVAVGDTLAFRDPQNPTAVTEWTIVGKVLHTYPYFLNDAALVGPERIYAAYADAQLISGFAGFNEIKARFTSPDAAKAGRNQFLEIMGTETPYRPYFSFTDTPEDALIFRNVRSVTDVLNMLAFVGMVVSAFLVVNIINSVVVEQKRQIGVMKSLGASRFDNFFIYAGMAFVYGVIGTIFGVALGVLLAGLIVPGLATEAETVIEDFRISTLGIRVGLFLGVIVPVLVALLPVFNGTRVSILDAMTDLGIASNWGKSRLSRLIAALPLPISVRQGLSNVVQKRGRLALTGATLTLAVAAFMGVTALFMGIKDQIKTVYDTYNFEVQITSRDAVSLDTMQAALAEVEGIGNVYPGYGTSVGVQGYKSVSDFDAGSNQMFALGIDPNSLVLDFEMAEGDGWENDPNRIGVVITEPLAEVLDKQSGDTLTLTVQGVDHEYEIIGINKYSFEALYLPWQELAQISGFVDDAGNAIPSLFFISIPNEPSVKAVDDKIAEIDTALLNAGIKAELLNQPKEAVMLADGLNVFLFIFNITSGVMAAVGAIGLLAALSMAVFERQKEIGVMRSIGAGASSIISQFMVEGLLVGIIAWVIAVPLSFVLGSTLMNALPFEGVIFTYPPQMIVIGLVGVIVVAALASIYPSFSASRKTVSDILRYQ